MLCAIKEQYKNPQYPFRRLEKKLRDEMMFLFSSEVQVTLCSKWGLLVLKGPLELHHIKKNRSDRMLNCLSVSKLSAT